METKKSDSVKSIMIVVAAAVSTVNSHADGACKKNSDETKQVCASWSEPGPPPVLETDFLVDYDCVGCTDNPAVQFVSGATTWNVYSEVIATGAPANIGGISTDPSIDTDNFAIKVANGTGAGASDVGSLVLNGASNPNWTGYSSLGAGSRISGDLTGDVTLIEDANGNGGDLDLTVDGDVGGSVIAWEIPQGATFKVGGVLSKSVHLGELFCCGGDVAGTIDIIKWDDDGVAPVIDIAGDITATGVVRVREFVPSGTNVLELRPFGDIAGDIILDNGIPVDAAVIGHAAFPAGASIDLRNADVGGFLELRGGGNGKIVDGGAVTGGDTNDGGVILGINGATFSGTASFASVSASGSIATIISFGGEDPAHLDGKLTILGAMDGHIGISGHVGSTGWITVGGITKGLIEVGEELDGDINLKAKMEGGEIGLKGVVNPTACVTILDMISDAQSVASKANFDDDFHGDLVLTNGIPAGQTVSIDGLLGARGEIDLTDDDVAGTLTIAHGGEGIVVNGGDVSGTVQLAAGSANAFSGTATFAATVAGGVIKTTTSADLDGDLNLTGACNGEIDIAGDLNGDIDVGGSASGDILVGGSLGGGGSLIVDGTVLGDVSIGDATTLSSAIAVGGIGSTGGVTINANEGDFHSDGTILVGSGGSFPLPDVTFDGFVLVNNEAFPGSGGGDLNAPITVSGCHADTTDLDICVCGTNNSSINIVQQACQNQVVASCSGCP